MRLLLIRLVQAYRLLLSPWLGSATMFELAGIAGKHLRPVGE